MTDRVLVAHPAARAPAGLTLAAHVTRAARGGVLTVRYRLAGPLERVRLPERAASQRADRLWEHTCFELFVAADGEARYIELNFAPSTAWAAYAFDSYRHGMRALELAAAPAVTIERMPDALVVTARADLGETTTAGCTWHVGLTAVVEDGAGQLSYWALRHATPKPDFHAAEGRVLRMEP